MTTWDEFVAGAPTVAGIFQRRHTATGNLCMLGTLRSDGWPRICPIEPRMFEGELVVGGMPDTRKFDDLARDPRFTLHTATVDTHVSDGDAKLWGVVENRPDPELHRRYTEALFAETGFDLRGSEFPHFYTADIHGASAVEIGDGSLQVHIWTAGDEERTVQKRP